MRARGTCRGSVFAAGTCITRRYVQIAAPDGEQGERVVATYFFERAAYLAIACLSPRILRA
ncbi:MAG: hypothetical protein ACLTYW_04405 [Collinsella sp.]